MTDMLNEGGIEDESEAWRKINGADSEASQLTSERKFGVDGADCEGKQRGETWQRWIESTSRRDAQRQRLAQRLEGKTQVRA